MIVQINFLLWAFVEKPLSGKVIMTMVTGSGILPAVIYYDLQYVSH